MKINKKNTSKWFDYQTNVKFHVRVPDMFNYSPPDEKSDFKTQYESVWKLYDYCLIGWEGVVDDDDNPAEFNSENKKLLFQFDQDLGKFIIASASSLFGEIISTEETKN